MPVRAALFSYFELDDLTQLMNAVAGFGEFHFVFENSRTFVMQDASRAVARGMAAG